MNGLSDRDLARLLVVFADSIEASGTRSVGFLREAARRIATGEAQDGGCERCGEPLEQKSTGRPRRFCSERCRRRKDAGKSIVAA